MTTNDKLADALRNIVNMLRDHPAMQGREYIDLGIAANNALRAYDLSLSAPPAQGEFLPADEQPPFAGIAGCRPLERAPQPAPVQVSQRTIYDDRSRIQRNVERAAGNLYVALKNLLDAVTERIDNAGIESITIADARNALELACPSGATEAPAPAPVQVDDVAEMLRTLLAERGNRTDGGLAELADRCLHLSREDRDCIAMMRRVAEIKAERARAAIAALAQQRVPDAVALIATERRRQVEAEGYSTEHDDEHATGELADAAACYALGVRTPRWPWGTDWWKPSPDNRVRELVKAGALIVAEIERLQRQEARGNGE